MANHLTHLFWLLLATGFLHLNAFSAVHSSNDLTIEEHENWANETESETNSDKLNSLITFRQILLKQDVNTCCPNWINLTEPALYEARNGGYRYSYRSYIPKPADLVAEIKRAFFNVTYLSIEGQDGTTERDRYYNFYDSFQYYLRLATLSKQYLASTTAARENSTATDVEFSRQFMRRLKTIGFKMAQDATLRNFMHEYNQSNDSHKKHFEFFEDFITETNFGRNYFSNVSMIKDSQVVFDHIYDHLTSADFPSNLTRPSKQYDIIRGLSQELFKIYHDVENQVEPRIANYRQEVRNMLKRLSLITLQRPYVRLLGDTYDANLGPHVVKFTHMLDLYLGNNLTHVSFYRQLYDLPSGFITLGMKIAHDYEEREIEHFTELRNVYQSGSSAYQPVTMKNSSQSNQEQNARRNKSSYSNYFFN